MALDLRQNFVSAQYLVDAFIMTRSNLGLLHVFFLHNCTRVMALDLCQNFLSAHYLENKSADFRQILYMHIY